MDVPQPATDPYDEGDDVVVYLGEDDPDAQYHGTDVVVVDRFTDSLNRESGRTLDKYLYRVKNQETGEILPVDFRHSDLVVETE